MPSIKNRKYHRRYPGAKAPRPDLAEIRQREATERQAKYDKLTTKQKLDGLDMKFGTGVGAGRQRARLLKALEKSQAGAAAETKVAEKKAQDKGARRTK